MTDRADSSGATTQAPKPSPPATAGPHTLVTVARELVGRLPTPIEVRSLAAALRSAGYQVWSQRDPAVKAVRAMTDAPIEVVAELGRRIVQPTTVPQPSPTVEEAEATAEAVTDRRLKGAERNEAAALVGELRRLTAEVERLKKELELVELRSTLAPSHLLDTAGPRWVPLVVERAALDDLERLPEKQLRTVWKALALYCVDRTYPSLRCKPAGPGHGELEGCWYCRASDNVRLFFRAETGLFRLVRVVVKAG